MLTADEIASMRTTVESALPDTCSITRRSVVAGAGTLNTATGELAGPSATVLWSGSCRVRSRAATARDVTVGDAHAVLGQYVATLPVDADGFDVDDYLTVTAATAAVELVGVPLQILEVQLGSWDLGRRVALQVSKPGE